MAVVEESAFRLVFGDTWAHVLKWDEHRCFERGIRGVQGTLDERDEGTKAVDVVGARGNAVWLLEIKDFRNRERAWTERAATLPLEIALKVRDTLAGLVGAHHAHAAEPWARPISERLVGQTPVTVIALLARPALARRLSDAKRKVHNDIETKRARQLLAWLTRRVYVIDPMRAEELARLPDVAVASLAQPRR